MKKSIYSTLAVFIGLTSQAATFTSHVGAGDWNTPATWTVSGSDADGIPDADDNIYIIPSSTVTVSVDNQFCNALVVKPGGVLTFNNVDLFTSNGYVTVNGTINGTFSGINHAFVKGASSNGFGGTGTLTITGDILFNCNAYTSSTVTINNQGNILIGAGFFYGPYGNVTLSGSVDGVSGSSKLQCLTGSVLTVGGQLMPTAGTVVASGPSYCVNNTIVFDGAGSYNLGATSFQNVIVRGTGTKTSSGSVATQFFGSLTIDAGATLAQGSSQDLWIKGSFTNNGTYSGSSRNVILTNASWINNGTFSCNGTLYFSGTATQTLSGSGTSTFNNIQMQNSSGVTCSSGNINITGAITLTAGTISNTGGTVSLKSDASKYARIAPISTSCGTCGFSGNFSVERFIPTRPTPTWADLSSPVVNSTMADWDNELYFSYPHDPYGSPAVESNVVEYDETVADYAGVNSGTALTAGKGFEIFLCDDATRTTFSTTTLTTVGTPNFGTQTINLSYTNNGGAPYPTSYDGENLVGNPFASAIKLNSITMNNTLSYVDVYDNASDNYLSLSGAASIGPHQGFWVYAQGPGASITIPESAKTTTTNTALKAAEMQQDEPFLQLTLSSTDAGNTMAYTLKVASATDANDGWDLKDHPYRKSRNPKAPALTANAENLKLSISTFNSNQDNYSMPLNLHIGDNGEYMINAKGLEFITNNYSCVRLEDKVANKTISLTSSSQYTFYANAGDDNNRFVLHFSKDADCKAMAAGSMNSIENNVTVLATPAGNLIHFNFDNTLPTTISVTNLLGQNIVETTVVDASNQSLETILPDSFQGMYLIKIENANGAVTKKFVKK